MAVVTRERPVVPEPVPSGGETPGSVARVRPPSLDSLFTLLFTIAGWCVGLRKLGDNSFLWHWRTGRLILDHGIPHADPYSFTVPGAKWIAQSWLAEVSYAVADKFAGAMGIRVLVALVGAATTGLLFRIALRTVRDRLRAATLTMVALASILTVWSERPLLFGLLAMVVLVYLVEFVDAPRALLVGIPVVMWLWANTHGTFSLGYVYLALHLAGRWADGAPFWQSGSRERRIAIASVVSFAILAVNPYGVSLLLFPLDLVRRGGVLDGVAEWNSPNFRHLAGMLFGAWLLTVIVLMARGRPVRRDVIVAVPFLFLALWALRNIGIATVVTVPIAGRKWATSRSRSDDRSPLGWAFLAGLLALALVWASNAAAGPAFALSDYPVAALHHVHDDGFMGKPMFTTDAWAGYVIAKYWPQQHVYMDDRYDMYPKRIVDDYDKIADVTPSWRATLDAYRIDVVVWPVKRSLSQALAEDSHWVRVYRDKVAVVYARR